MKKYAIAFEFVCGLCACAGVRADNTGGSVGWVSDKVVYGLSQTAGLPSAAASVYHRLDTGWAASVSVANLRQPLPALPALPAETVLALTHSRVLDDGWSLSASWGHYHFLRDQRRQPDYNELSGTLAWRDRWQLVLIATPDLSYRLPTGDRRRGLALGYELSWRQDLPAGWMLDVGIGYWDTSRLGSPAYTYGSATVSTDLGPLRVMLSGITSNAASQGRPAAVAGQRWVASAWWAF